MRSSQHSGATSRSTKAGSYSVVLTAAVIAIAVVLNLIVAKLPATYTQFDVSSASLFTPSQQTEELVSGLQEDISVYWIVQSGSEDSTLEHLLDRYDALSDHLKVSKVDPVVNPTFVSQYSDEQISNNSLLVVGNDRARYVPNDKVFPIDLAAYYQTGSFTQEFDGENALTSAIDYLVSEDLPRAYALTCHGEFTFEDEFAAQIESQNIEVEILDLLSTGAIPDDCASLLLCSPKSDLTEQEAAIVSDYLAAGGHLMLITNFVRDDTPNLDAILAGYGVTAAPGMVIEGNANYTIASYPHYILPTVASHAITDPLINSGYRVLTAFNQGLMVSDDVREGVTVTQLLTSTDASYAKQAGLELQTVEKEDGDIDGPFCLAAAIEESVEDGTTQIVWLPSTYFFDSELNSAVNGANFDFVLNALGWLCERESAISIHAKSMQDETLLVPNGTVTVLALVLIVLIPLALLITGIVITVRRRRR